jgi:hypothetical protein
MIVVSLIHHLPVKISTHLQTSFGGGSVSVQPWGKIIAIGKWPKHKKLKAMAGLVPVVIMTLILTLLG